MRRGLLLAFVVTLLALAPASLLLAQENPNGTEPCEDAAPAAYQYDCDEPCAPQQQYPEDEAGGCVTPQYQYDSFTADASCSDANNVQAEEGMAGAGDIIQGLPPASVQNVVVEAANSVSKDAPEASRALDTAKPAGSAEKVALAAEAEPVEEPPADSPVAPEEPVADDTTPPPATAPDIAASPTEPAETVETPEAVQPAGGPAEATQRAESTQPTEASEVNVDREGDLEEVEGELAASTADAPGDPYLVSLFALGGITLLIGCGLLVRKIVG